MDSWTYRLILLGHVRKLFIGKHRPMLTDELIPDIASSAFSDPALHPHLERVDNPVRLKPQFDEDR